MQLHPKDYLKIPSFKVANYFFFLNLNDQGIWFWGEDSLTILPPFFQVTTRSKNSFAKKKTSNSSGRISPTASEIRSVWVSPHRRIKEGRGERKKWEFTRRGFQGAQVGNRSVPLTFWRFIPGYWGPRIQIQNGENPRVDVKRPPGQNHGNRMHVLLHVPVSTTNINN